MTVSGRLIRLTKRSVKWLAWRIYVILPKRKIAVLSGYTGYDDSVLALEKGLRETPIKKIVVLVPPGAGPRRPEVGPGTVFVGKGSLRGFAYFSLAKYVFFTHDLHVHRFAPRSVSVSVWHGMPVKRIGWMNNEGPLVPIMTYSIATSPVWAEVVQDSLRPLAGTLVTGLPRNDRLFLRNETIRPLLGCPPAAAGDAGTGDAETGDIGAGKLIIWLPTFRGAWEEARHTLGVPDGSLAAIDEVLERHGAVLVVKPHPMASYDRLPELRRFRLITDGWLQEQGISLYELLGQADALISDLSSVYIDFLVLDRPVVHHFPDIDEYERTRGFSVGPIADYLAGPLTRDSDELLAAISAVAQGEDTHAAQRRRAQALSHSHADASATARLLEAVGLRSAAGGAVAGASAAHLAGAAAGPKVPSSP
jgi:CDP-glycerol glycerophosphotransferase